jgi:hypothetical protein
MDRSGIRGQEGSLIEGGGQRRASAQGHAGIFSRPELCDVAGEQHAKPGGETVALRCCCHATARSSQRVFRPQSSRWLSDVARRRHQELDWLLTVFSTYFRHSARLVPDAGNDWDMCFQRHYVRAR